MQTPGTVPPVINQLLKGRVPVEVRGKPGRFIIRTTLPDGAGQERPVYLKVYPGDGFWDRIKSRIFGHLALRSPAQVERANLSWASAHGIPVPRVISAAPELLQQESASISLLVTEELSGMSALHVLIPTAARTVTPANFRRWKHDLGDEIARLARCLHQTDRFHKDLYLCHFFLPDVAVTDLMPVRGRLHLLDFLRLKQHRWNKRRWQVKDLAELLYSSDVPGIDTRDRLRFMHAYLGCRKLNQKGRRLVRSVVRKAARYRRQNRKSSESRTEP